MNNDAKTVTALPGFQLRVELVDGRIGVFDLKPHLHTPALSALRNPDYFNRVRLLFGAVTWPDGEDIAPDTLAAELHLLQVPA